jgi:hypothetical protein
VAVPRRRPLADHWRFSRPRRGRLAGSARDERARPNEGFYATAGEPKEIWEVPNGQHIAGITTEPEEYERRVLAFFDDALATLD